MKRFAYILGIVLLLSPAYLLSSGNPGRTNCTERNSPHTENVGVTASVGSHAATVGLTLPDGSSTPGNGLPAIIRFRNTSLTTGGFDTYELTTGPGNLTIPQGTTLGQVNQATETTYIYVFYYSGNPYLAVSTVNTWDENVLQTTTAISGGSDRNKLYSATARSNVPVVLLGWFKSQQTTAGQWDTSPSEVSVATPFSLTGSPHLAPTVQTFTSGTGTYTTPSSPAPLYIRVRMVGGGGGGGGSGTAATNGTAGNNTTFGGLTANGGARGTGSNAGAGGAASLGTGWIGLNLTGGNGSDGGRSATAGDVISSGGCGGNSAFAGGGRGGGNGTLAGGAGSTNTGGGGGGGGSSGTGTATVAAGGGGGSGGIIDATLSNPAASYSYSVGGTANGGAAGTSGNAGGNGAAGIIIVEEFYH
jgi:hypothetical protein